MLCFQTKGEVGLQKRREEMTEQRQGGELGLQFVAQMPQITMDRIGAIGIANTRANLQHLHRGQSLAALRDETIGEGDCAIVIAAGPSIKRRDVASRI